MKYTVALTAACIASASAFAPSAGDRASTQLAAEKKSFFSTVFDMDLFAPQKEQNDYGARNKKNVSAVFVEVNAYLHIILC